MGKYDSDYQPPRLAGRTSYIICRANCKMKTQCPCLKSTNMVRKSRVKPSMGPCDDKRLPPVRLALLVQGTLYVKMNKLS